MKIYYIKHIHVALHRQFAWFCYVSNILFCFDSHLSTRRSLSCLTTCLHTTASSLHRNRMLSAHKCNERQFSCTRNACFQHTSATSEEFSCTGTACFQHTSATRLLHTNSMLSAHKSTSEKFSCTRKHAFSTQVQLATCRNKAGSRFWRSCLRYPWSPAPPPRRRPTTLPTACNAIKRLLKMQSNDCTNDSNESNDLQQTTSQLPRLPLHRRSQLVP